MPKASQDHFDDDISDSEDEMMMLDDAAVPKGRKALLANSSSSSRDDASKKRKEADTTSGGKEIVKNRQRVLILSSRGITQRYRHLLNDLHVLMPHSKKDSKLDTKSKLHILNEVCSDTQCNNCIFFEVRKFKDLFMWISRTPNGPSVKFFVESVHTMDELRMTGNCLKGSRPILSFDNAFDDAARPHLGLIKEIFSQVFGTPKTSRKIKPFIDHVLTFSVVNDRIWFRNYQTIEKDGETSLVEIGPRFSLSIIRIFNGSFTGSTLYENPEYVSPNTQRRDAKAADQAKYMKRVNATAERDARRAENGDVIMDPLADVFE